MPNLKPKLYNFASIQGISEHQLREHYSLYEAYVKKVNELDSMDKLSDCFKDANATFSCMRSVKLGETFALNGVILHQLYFENITNPCGSPNSKMMKLINSQWHSKENFMNCIKSACLSMRGWVIVCVDYLTKSLRIIGLDAHDVGSLWCATPLMVIDVYEHAYFLDFGTNRGKYVDTIFGNLNWNSINARVNCVRI